jgi:hypothetical protein
MLDNFCFWVKWSYIYKDINYGCISVLFWVKVIVDR